MSIRLNAGQRALLADKIGDAGNLALGALIFGQVLAERPFSTAIGLLGGCAWLVFMVAATLLRGSRR